MFIILLKKKWDTRRMLLGIKCLCLVSQDTIWIGRNPLDLDTKTKETRILKESAGSPESARSQDADRHHLNNTCTGTTARFTFQTDERSPGRCIRTSKLWRNLICHFYEVVRSHNLCILDQSTLISPTRTPLTANMHACEKIDKT